MNVIKETAIYWGPILGFTVFLVNVGSMDGVLMRPDDMGKKVFTLQGLAGYLEAPLDFGSIPCKTVWGDLDGISLWSRTKMIGLNWIVMTGLGLGLGYVITKCI